MQLPRLEQKYARVSAASAIVLVLIVSVVVIATSGSDSNDAKQCRAVTMMNEARDDTHNPVTIGTGPTTVVLGDSYAQGAGMGSPRTQSWPFIFGSATGRTVWVNAVGATGYTNSGYCDGQDFRSRVDAVLARSPATVVVEGGLNDTSAAPQRLAAAADALFAALRSVPTVVVVGPSAAPAFPPDKVRAVDLVLAASAKRAGRQYVSTLTWTLPLLNDRIHPTSAGQALYGQLLAVAVPF